MVDGEDDGVDSLIVAPHLAAPVPRSLELWSLMGINQGMGAGRRSMISAGRATDDGFFLQVLGSFGLEDVTRLRNRVYTRT